MEKKKIVSVAEKRILARVRRKMLRYGCVLFSLLLAIVSGSNSLDAAARPLALLATVDVSGDAILLANLLPHDAEPAVRTVGSKISLGASPQAGSVRILSRETVTNVVLNAGLPLDSFVIPELISVHRASESVTRESVYAAIQASPSARNWPQLAALRPSDLIFNSATSVPRADVPLSVTQIIYDRYINSFHFRIQARTVPATIPFYVTAHISSVGDTGHSEKSLALKRIETPPNFSAVSPTLVDPAHPARLHLHSRDFDSVLEVRPLQRGHLGEVIRVRLSGSGKIIQAHVVALGSLDELL